MIRFKDFKLAIFLAVLCIAVLCTAAVQAWASDYVLELTIVTDKQQEYDLFIEMTDRQLRDLRQDSRNKIRPYLVEARKQYADEIGYRKEIYGEKNYQMVVIASYRYVVREKSSGRILLSK